LSKILVTGGAGFIGSNLVMELLNQGNEIVVFDNEFRGSFNNLQDKKIHKVSGDITKINDWKNLPKDISSIYHLGAINGTKFFYEIPEKVMEVNTKGIMNCLEFTRERDIEKILFTSSSEIYGFPKIFPTPETEEMVIPDPYNPRFSYSSSKILGELLCINYAKKYGFKHTIVRYHNIYGPNMGHEHVIPEFVRKLVNKEEFNVEGDGTESRSFCYIDDAVKGTILVNNEEKAENRIYNIGNPEETTINELILLLSTISGIEIKPNYKLKNQAGTKRRQPDIKKAMLIGYEPKIPLTEGLAKTYEWYKNYFLK
jgi:nucleoside-diphosphate-sugar epimerase|tara:strand:+ start:2674 stop:3612 length:939 start_codon:yes stop_codon:yes gene_type:complete